MVAAVNGPVGCLDAEAAEALVYTRTSIVCECRVWVTVIVPYIRIKRNADKKKH